MALIKSVKARYLFTPTDIETFHPIEGEVILDVVDSDLTVNNIQKLTVSEVNEQPVKYLDPAEID